MAASRADRWRSLFSGPATRIVVVGLVIVLAVSGIVATARGVDALRPSPERLVLEYLRAIADGDATRANALALPTESDQRFLSDAVLADASERIADISIVPDDGDEPAAGSVQVEAEYSLGGRHTTWTATVVRIADGPFGTPNWRLTTSLALPVSVTIPALGDASLSGTSVRQSAVTADESVELVLYPGVYTLTGVASVFATTSTESVIVNGDGDDSGPFPALSVEALPRLTSDLQAAVDDYLAFCASAPANHSWSCPRPPTAGDATMTLVTPPVVDVSSFTPVSYASWHPTFTATGGTAQWTSSAGVETGPLDETWTYSIIGEEVHVSYGTD